MITYQITSLDIEEFERAFLTRHFREIFNNTKDLFTLSSICRMFGDKGAPEDQTALEAMGKDKASLKARFGAEADTALGYIQLGTTYLNWNLAGGKASTLPEGPPHLPSPPVKPVE